MHGGRDGARSEATAAAKTTSSILSPYKIPPSTVVVTYGFPPSLQSPPKVTLSRQEAERVARKPSYPSALQGPSQLPDSKRRTSSV